MSYQHLALVAALTGAAACSTSTSSGHGDDLPPFTNGVSTLSGAADPGFVDGPRGTARFFNPTGVAVGPDGDIYIADFDNGKIRKVSPDGTTSTLVAQKGFARPFGLAFAGTTLYATTDNNIDGKHGPGKSGSVWRIDTGAGTATNLANAIGMPRGIAPLADGRLALADYENHVIEILDPSSGAVIPLAGALGQAGYADGVAGAARFSAPLGLVQRGDGKLVVADRDNNRLRLVGLDGTVSTLAGTGQSGYADGSMTSAMFKQPYALAIDGSGKIYLSDWSNFRVRVIDGSNLTTIAGDGNPGWVDDDDRMAAEFFGLEGIAVTKDGHMVYVGVGGRGEDQPHNYIRQIKLN
jgi:DNA-binding beta-propeller fold protein YncE